MDIVPTHKLYANTTKQFATWYFHWFFLIQDAPLPETLIQNNTTFALREWAFKGIPKEVIPEDIFQEYLKHFSDPTTLHAMCEDYRAGATIDLEHDETDLTTKVSCPVLVLWGSRGAMDPLFNVLETWKERASQVSGKSLPCGHWMAEQLPEEVTAEVRQFLK